jgi:hypothetical protein
VGLASLVLGVVPASSDDRTTQCSDHAAALLVARLPSSDVESCFKRVELYS